MPKFEVVALSDAVFDTATGKRSETLKEYVDYIQSVGKGQAGVLSPEEGDKTTTIRRRLGAAAKQAGKKLIVKRKGQEIYFWTVPRGRRPANQNT